jgi:hypothetical protein
VRLGGKIMWVNRIPRIYLVGRSIQYTRERGGRGDERDLRRNAGQVGPVGDDLYPVSLLLVNDGTSGNGEGVRTRQKTLDGSFRYTG